MSRCFNQVFRRDMLSLSFRSWILPFKIKQSSIEWLISRSYGQYFGLSVHPTSTRHFISGNVRMLCSKIYSNNSLIFSQIERIFSPGILGVTGAFHCSFASVHFVQDLRVPRTFWYKTCAMTGGTAGEVFFVTLGCIVYSPVKNENFFLWFILIKFKDQKRKSYFKFKRN